MGYALDTSDYADSKVVLIENTPEEIRDLSIEMLDRIHNRWEDDEIDKELQKRAKHIFMEGLVKAGIPDVFEKTTMHGQIYSLFSSTFLRNNQQWIK